MSKVVHVVLSVQDSVVSMDHDTGCSVDSITLCDRTVGTGKSVRIGPSTCGEKNPLSNWLLSGKDKPRVRVDFTLSHTLTLF